MRFLPGPPPDTHAPVPDALWARLDALAVPCRTYRTYGAFVVYAPRWALRLIEDWPLDVSAIEETTLRRIIRLTHLSGDEARIDAYLSVARLGGHEALARMVDVDQGRILEQVKR